MKTLVPLLAFALLLTGCDKIEKTTQDLQQEKVLLELMQVQQDQLAALTQKERDLRASEKRSQDGLQDIDQQQVALRRSRRRKFRRARWPRTRLPSSKLLSVPRENRSMPRRRSVQAAEARCRKLEHELTDRRANLLGMQSAIQTNRRVDSAKRESDRLEAEAKLRTAIAARVKKRELALQSLAALTAELLGSGLEQEASRVELLDLLHRSKIAEIEDQGVFVVMARGLAESYYLDKILYPHLVRKPRAFIEWGQPRIAAGDRG